MSETASRTWKSCGGSATVVDPWIDCVAVLDGDASAWRVVVAAAETVNLLINLHAKLLVDPLRGDFVALATEIANEFGIDFGIFGRHGWCRSCVTGSLIAGRFGVAPSAWETVHQADRVVHTGGPTGVSGMSSVACFTYMLGIGRADWNSLASAEGSQEVFEVCAGGSDHTHRVGMPRSAVPTLKGGEQGFWFLMSEVSGPT